MEPISSLQAEEARLRSKLANNPFFSSASNLFQFLRWMLISTLTGLVVGSVSTIFNFGLKFAVDFRHAHLWVVLFLPVAGLAIVFLYRFFHYENNAGTDTVINSIHKEAHIPLRMSFLIFVSTILTVLCGGSVGREGAAMQIGGSIGEQIGEKLRFNEKDKKIMLMSGISAAFSALFGTPLAATVFAIMVISIGVLYHVALYPSLLAALVAYGVSVRLGVEPTRFTVAVPDQSVGMFVRVAALGVLCALVSILFCKLMHGAGHLMKRIKNPWLRVICGGFAVIALTWVFGTDYNGAGMDIVTRAIEQETVAVPWAFLLKLVFTAVTLAAGFKGGEVVPSFFVGATFGCAVSPLLGLPVGFGAAVGLAAVFCGVTNCPVASTLLAVELFGAEGMLYFALACCLSYMLSGYQGLYSSQTILYSKLKAQFINVHTNAYHAGEKTE